MGNDLLALIKDILDLSKIEAGKVQLTVELVSVTEVLDGLRAHFEPLARQKGLEILLEIDARCPPHIASDRLRLRQILLNLLSKAVKFTERGSVRILARPRGVAQIEIRIIDTR